MEFTRHPPIVGFMADGSVVTFPDPLSQCYIIPTVGHRACYPTQDTFSTWPVLCKYKEHVLERHKISFYWTFNCYVEQGAGVEIHERIERDLESLEKMLWLLGWNP